MTKLRWHVIDRQGRTIGRFADHDVALQARRELWAPGLKVVGIPDRDERDQVLPVCTENNPCPGCQHLIANHGH